MKDTPITVSRSKPREGMARSHARSASTLIFAALGFLLASGLIIPLDGVPFVGPWLFMLLGLVVGGFVGYMVGPLFDGLFRRDGALREEPKALSDTDPVSGLTVPRPARDAV